MTQPQLTQLTQLTQAPQPLLVREPVRAVRLAAADLRGLAALLDADDATLVGRAPMSLTTPATPATPATPTGVPVRIGVVDPTPKRLAAARAVVRRAVDATQAGQSAAAWRGARDIWFTTSPLLHEPGAGLAFVFPGLEVEFTPRVADVAAHFGLPLPELDAGNIGRHARSVVALGRLLDQALRRIGIAPDAVAGQSIGEWTAMAAAGMRRPDDMDRMMSGYDPDAVSLPDVDYAVLGCGVSRARRALDTIGGVVLSHDNAPNQVMVCGPSGPIGELLQAMRSEGVIAQRLNFRSGYHTPMFEPYLEPYRVMAREFDPQPPQVPVWSATTAAPYPRDPAGIRALFLRNLLEPVMFRPMIEAMYAAGSRVFVQLGSGQLSSLIDGTLGDQPHLAIPSMSRKRDGLDQLLRVATAVWVEGGDPDPAALSVRPGDRLQLIDRPAPEPAPGTESEPQSPPEPDPLLGNDFGAGFPRTIRFGVDDLPWVIDHAFFRQAPGWPDPADLRLVVPATSLAEFMARWAEEAAPGCTAVAVQDVRLLRWVQAEPADEAVVAVARTGTDTVRVTVGEHCEGTVRLARAYPPADTEEPPEPGPELDRGLEPELEPGPVTDEVLVPARISAATVYAERIMFHDGAFRGISRVYGVGDHSVRGEITVTGTPGSLMDNVGQLIAVWLEHHDLATVAFPVRFDALRFFGPEPAAGERVDVELQIRSFGSAEIVADAQVYHHGRLIARVDGWHDRRFLTDPALMPAFRFPERWPQAARQQGGWVLVADRWNDLTARELIAAMYLSRAERAQLAATSPRGRRGFLLGRIAAKDAVRQLLWAQGHGPIFPAQIRVGNEPDGRPVVTGVHGLQLPPLAISIAHSGELGVAIARPARPGVSGTRSTVAGIDVEQVTERSPGVLDIALGAAERQLYDSIVGRGGESSQLWFTRFWAAKEAVAKAEGTGLHGRPQRFRVVAATPSALDVVVDDEVGDQVDDEGWGNQRQYRVRCSGRVNPPGLTARQYVVAWTIGGSPAVPRTGSTAGGDR